ncbi:MAG TPA: choice-of-anchor tandem repeat GloVer-containing protein, partial [Tepidisphaeraceae bacterium]|nr:choice-of-anchor tandem repeat GloVer-containing protein [Tepidisphaeraceae bacterium]
MVFNTLASFGSAPQGILPQSTLAVDGSGNLFGDTTSGGASGDGTVFEVANGTTTISTIASFDGTDGQKPEDGVVIDSSGDLFGTTNTGGASGDGTVFEIASGSNTITTLASFDGTNGANPDTGLIRDSSGDLFGTTAAGGASSDGTVFEIVNGSNAITTLASFDGADGSSPQGSLAVDSSGDLFGTTSTGGTANDGVVWELPTGASSLVPLASFSGANGQTPEGGLLLSGSTLYGTTSAGGAGGFGNVFQISDTGGALTAVASFDSTDGEYPQSGLIADGSGDLFGVATAGGSNDAGDVFEVVSGSNGITDVASFNFSNGSLPEAQPVLVNGNLFGTTDEGGTDAVGSVYEIVSGSGAVTTVASFDQTASNPMGNLLQDGSGDLFGTTSDGDGDNAGAVFDIPGGTGAFSLVTTFDGTDGDGPSGGVIEDSSGDLFGTTGGGGPDDDGTVFEISSGSNTPTTLATFTGDNGKDPQLSSLVMDSS